MTRWVLVAALVLAACKSDSARVAALEKRIDELERSRETKAMPDAAVVDAPSGRWWCVSPEGSCYRDRERCERGGYTCPVQRIAWCPIPSNDGFCVSTFERCKTSENQPLCLDLKPSGSGCQKLLRGQPCVGVE